MKKAVREFSRTAKITWLATLTVVFLLFTGTLLKIASLFLNVRMIDLVNEYTAAISFATIAFGVYGARRWTETRARSEIIRQPELEEYQ